MPDKKEILDEQTLTFAEKIASLRAVNGGRVYRSDELAILPADLAMAQDSTGPLAIRSLQEMGISRLWDPSRILLVIDHTYPASDEKVANLHQMIRRFAATHYTLLTEGNISHQYIMENFAVPGMTIFGADSHTCEAGAVGAFATGVGSTEMAALWATGRLWVRVPRSIILNLTGELRKGVLPRDVILYFIGQVGEDGANYRSLEWRGPSVKDLSIWSRATIANNSMECGCKLSVFESDEVTRRYLAETGRKPIMEVYSGPEASYEDEFEIELGKIEPMANGPDNMDKAQAVSGLQGQPIDQAFIGSSANGSIEDLALVARILKGRRVKKGVRCIITPASARVFEHAISLGYAQTFLHAGAVFTNATCGACVGTHLGVLGEDEVCISSSTRNFSGRMGAFSAKIYIASPATVAASAIEGKIADPSKYV